MFFDSNVYKDARCPECGGDINEYGFCYDCGLDWEEYERKAAGIDEEGKQ